MSDMRTGQALSQPESPGQDGQNPAPAGGNELATGRMTGGPRHGQTVPLNGRPAVLPDAWAWLTPGRTQADYYQLTNDLDADGARIYTYLGRF